MERRPRRGEEGQAPARVLRRAAAVVAWLAGTVALFALSRANYLLYHSAVEFLDAVVFASVFAIAWNTRRFARSPLLFALASGSLVVGVFDVVHVLAYKGMGVFPDGGANLPTQLWIAGRYVQTASFLAAALAVRHPRWAGRGTLLGLFLGLGAALGAAIALGAFPACYVPGQGLTAFKVGSEYGACAVLALSAVLLSRRGEMPDAPTRRLLLGAVAALIAAGLSFTLYVDVYGFFNFLGHVLKLVATVLVYLALVRGSLVFPYRSLFRELSASEEALRAEVEERRRAEAQAREAREAAEAASRAKSAFLANMSHEIRTPMNGVIGLTDLVLATDLAPAQRRHLEMAKGAADSLMRVIDDILDFSKIEAGRLDFDDVPFDVRAVVEQAVEPVAHRARAKGLTLAREVDPGVPRAVKGDPGRLRQVLVNLLANAVKFTDRGEVALHVEAEPGGEELGRMALRFSVSDTGPGIPPDQVGRLFRSFEQLDSSLQRRHSGTGLGLAISKRIVEAMGGTIGVESRGGAGSTFAFTVPFEAAEPAGAGSGAPASGGVARGAAPGEAPVSGIRARETPVPAAQPSQRRVLVAEDNPVNRLLAETLLQQEGCLVDCVPDGRAALEALEAQAYDLVLMDVQMPELDGLEATRLLRAREERTGRRTPVVGLTAHALKGDRERCLSAGMDDYLPKPFPAEALRATVARWSGPPSGCVEPAVDLAGSLGPVLQDRDLMARLVGAFLPECPGQLRELRESVERADPVRLERAAHRLRGSVGLFGAHSLVRRAEALEAMARGGQLEGAAELLRNLEHELGKLREDLAAYLPEASADTAPPSP